MNSQRTAAFGGPGAGDESSRDPSERDTHVWLSENLSKEMSGVRRSLSGLTKRPGVSRRHSSLRYSDDQIGRDLGHQRAALYLQSYTFHAAHHLPWHKRRCAAVHGHAYRFDPPPVFRTLIIGLLPEEMESSCRKVYRELVITASNLHERARSVAIANRPANRKPATSESLKYARWFDGPDACQIARALNAMANQVRHDLDASNFTSDDDASERHAVARSH